MVMPDDRDITFDTTVYNVCVSVKETDGVLYAYVVVINKQTQEKPDSVHFKNVLVAPTEAPTAIPTEPASSVPTTAPGGSTHQPQTGDDTKMERYLLIAMFASAGLFLLAVLYTVDTNRLYKRKKNRS